MKKPFLLLIALLAALTVPLVQAKDTVAAHYIEPASIDLKTLLPNPPAPGSEDNRKDLEAVLEKQKTRTPAEIARAESEVKLKVWVFEDVLGSWFNAKDLPITDALFKNVSDDAHAVSDQAKAIWNRPRPPLEDKSVKPAVELEKSGSYPSGHATRGLLFALVLAELAPDLKDKLIARGKLIGEDRVIAGVHYPSDVDAGFILSTALFDKFKASPAFQAELAKAKAEFDAARAAAKK